MAGISSKAAGGVENKKKYNGIEFDNDLDLNLYEAFYRDLDPQTGRFLQIDPKIEGQETESPYSSMANNPILKGDPLGDEPESGSGDPPGVLARIGNAVSGAFSVLGDRVLTNIAKDGEWVKSTLSTLGANAEANWAGGNTIIQQFIREPISLLGGVVGMEIKEVQIVERAMSRAELKATESTNLMRGGREGTHHVSDAIGNDAKRVQQRLALDKTPQVKVTLEVPKGSFTPLTKIKPTETMPGGGMERKAIGNIPVKVLKVKDLKNTGN